MTTAEQINLADAKRASRAIGAMFFTIFGGLWIGLWSYQAFPHVVLYRVVIAFITLALFIVVLRRYLRYRPALAAQPDDPDKRRRDQLFNLVNAGQWILIVLGVNVLNNLGYPHWAIPLAIFIIGLHFIPLAAIFSNPPHYITGIALMLVAAVYPLVLQNGPQNPLGCLATGLILWASSLWAVKPEPRSGLN